ncbi:cAMP-regulated phosphoprotein 19 [Ischnura elegans]|uniref:cAMP-regulated phosphoprotein 19 n=1 Tax=Ischnura elegans TaxID=197161 RepID=UPI001ED8989E|nr:cAMP-regulated phosphoprotein 19 [Ischnura elegans]
MSEEAEVKTNEPEDTMECERESKESEENNENEPEEPLSNQELEKIEEAKLKTKYPKAVLPMTGHSGFLQKRLAKGQKYFDSGDYQMAKQKKAPTAKARVPPVLAFATGEAIPTPESVPVRKTSIIQQSKLATSSSNT